MACTKMSLDELKPRSENARRILNEDFENTNALTALVAVDKEISRRERDGNVGRRPVINYFDCGLTVGQSIEFTPDPSQQIRVYNGRELEWNGRPIHLTPLRHKLSELYDISVGSRDLFKVNGITLHELYEDTYGPLEKTNLD